jgi:predicted nuclease of predicted toxin-antitoxin system
MKFLIDHQLPIALAVFFRQRGHDSKHVIDLGSENLSDAAIWKLAQQEHRVLVSKDEDFVFLAHQAHGDAALVWVRLGNCRKVQLLQAFDRSHDDLVHALAQGHRIVELR